MNEKTGEVFSIARDNEPVPGCTTSKAVYQHDAASIVYFSLAAHTDISPETYGYHKLIHVEAGALRVYTSGGTPGSSAKAKSSSRRRACPWAWTRRRDASIPKSKSERIPP